MIQRIIEVNENYDEVGRWLGKSKKMMLVCGQSITRQKINTYLEMLPKILGVKVVRFMDFLPNPLYESVVKGVQIFREEHCDAIVAVGGGSAIDVAKCIKLYSNMSGNGEMGSYLRQKIVPNDIPFLAMPTTAGTGSEATQYAVVYYDGKKQSVTSESCIPDTVLLEPECLITLPLYQKKATMMDTLCHAIESFWSVNSTDESKEYSRAAIKGVLNNMDAYLENDEMARYAMLTAANMAGKAINITQTTAGHAMCYKITSLFGLSHGHAASLCDRVLFPWMVDNTDKCIDLRGEKYLKSVFDDIAVTMGCKNAKAAAVKFQNIFDKLELEVPTATAEQYEELRTSVNSVRLKNNPIGLEDEIIDMLYHRILR